MLFTVARLFYVFPSSLAGHLYNDSFFMGPVLFYVVDLRYVTHSCTPLMFFYISTSSPVLVGQKSLCVTIYVK